MTSNSPLQIRPATREDFDLLSELERTAARRFLDVLEATAMTSEQLEDTLSREELERALAENGLWIAEWGRQPAGFIATHRYQDSLYIREVDVLQQYGRRGVGKALIGRALEHARKLRLPLVFLRTFRRVEWNAPFYARIGFVTIEEKDWSDAMRGIVEEEDGWGLERERRDFMGVSSSRLLPNDGPYLLVTCDDARVNSIRWLVGGYGTDAFDDNIDVWISLADSTDWQATLITPTNIRTLMQRWSISGENCGGYYLKVPDMIVVRSLNPEDFSSFVIQSLSDGTFSETFTQNVDPNE